MAIKLYSRDAEFTILGQLLTDSKLVNKVLGRLEADDFYFPENKAVYNAIQRSFKEKQSTDAILVISYLQESKLMSHDE